MTVSTQIRLAGRGPVSEWMRAYALAKVGHVISTAGRPVLDSRVVLTQALDPARRQRATAAACLDVGGMLVHGSVSAPGMREAVDELEALLRRRLDRLSTRARTRRRDPRAVARLRARVALRAPL